ncbi:hypothetical protein Salmuc_00494 [Salipiger mucosus DSM 16094]|uniref:Uncharacterized protein n=1 Tax=Salipiger mucosus DSM 16094 TaxID=1123237 RepID=S9Q9L2_9RHOB|nr:hypothetical protein Salmuc_00494 [Salipiger mucosus DSM 16094]
MKADSGRRHGLSPHFGVFEKLSERRAKVAGWFGPSLPDKNL